MVSWKNDCILDDDDVGSGKGEPTENRIWRNWSSPWLEQRGISRGFGASNETSTGGKTKKKVVRINIE